VTRSYRTRHALRIVSEVAGWQGHPPEMLQKMLERLRQELMAPPQTQVPTLEPSTVGDFAQSWLKLKLKRGDIHTTTAGRYADALDLHVLPRFGSFALHALTPSAIDQAIAEWSGKYARETVNGWLRVLRTMLADAVAQKLIPDNPASMVRALRERVEDEEDDEAQHFISSFSIHPVATPKTSI